MPVRIEKIHVQNLGPHNRFAFELGQLNLIYGHNENGKTFLVEFIIRALFKNQKKWSLRQSDGSGKVFVSGLGGGKMVDFSPVSEKKIEDFWQDSQIGLPPDFSKLLVVKGADVDLAKVNGGIDKTIIKNFLSNKIVLDNIQNRISKTIQKASYKDGFISGSRVGELSARSDFESDLKKIEQLFSQIDKGFSGGKIKECKMKLEQLSAGNETMQLAKRNLAYKTENEIVALRQQLHKASIERILDIKNQFSQYKANLQALKRKELLQKKNEQSSEHYEWLKSAQTVYQNNLSQEAEQPPAYLVILIALLIIAAGVLSFLKLPIYAITSLAVALINGIIYFRLNQKMLSQALGNHEIENIGRKFSKNFKRDFNGLADISDQLQKMEDHYNDARLLKRQIDDDCEALNKQEIEISEQINDLAEETVELKSWDELLLNFEEEARSLEQQLKEKEHFGARLNIEPALHVSDKPIHEFNQEKAIQIENEIAETERTIDSENQKLESLKQLLCQATGDDINDSWEDIISNLRGIRLRTIEQLKDRTAEILGKLVVNEVLEEFRTEEDIKIEASLNSEIVQKPIFELTNRYENLVLENGKLVVSDDFNSFELEQLSSGAQEQILLALRIGLSQHLTKGEPMFLILDDAFQYSDWRRRKFLMNKIVELVQNGWQIIYFTMDDNIKALFEQSGKAFGDDFKLINLNPKQKTARQLDI